MKKSILSAVALSLVLAPGAVFAEVTINPHRLETGQVKLFPDKDDTDTSESSSNSEDKKVDVTPSKAILSYFEGELMRADLVGLAEPADIEAVKNYLKEDPSFIYYLTDFNENVLKQLTEQEVEDAKKGAVKANLNKILVNKEDIEKNAQKIRANTLASQSNALEIEKSNQAIAENAQKIDYNTSASRSNALEIEKSNQAIEKNAQKIDANTSASKSNALEIQKSNQAIAANVKGIAVNAKGVAANVKTIDDLRDDIAFFKIQNEERVTKVEGRTTVLEGRTTALEGRMSTVESQVSKLEKQNKQFKGALAATAALTQTANIPETPGKVNLNAGIGYYDGATAVAVGLSGSAKLTEKTNLGYNLGVGMGSQQKGPVVGAGVSIGLN